MFRYVAHGHIYKSRLLKLLISRCSWQYCMNYVTRCGVLFAVLDVTVILKLLYLQEMFTKLIFFNISFFFFKNDANDSVVIDVLQRVEPYKPYWQIRRTSIGIIGIIYYLFYYKNFTIIIYCKNNNESKSIDEFHYFDWVINEFYILLRKILAISFLH